MALEVEARCTFRLVFKITDYDGSPVLGSEHFHPYVHAWDRRRAGVPEGSRLGVNTPSPSHNPKTGGAPALEFQTPLWKSVWSSS